MMDIRIKFTTEQIIPSNIEGDTPIVFPAGGWVACKPKWAIWGDELDSYIKLAISDDAQLQDQNEDVYQLSAENYDDSYRIMQKAWSYLAKMV